MVLTARIQYCFTNSKRNARQAGACVECPKRTGHNVLLFEGIAAQHDSCSNPKCYAANVDAHVRQAIFRPPGGDDRAIARRVHSGEDRIARRAFRQGAQRGQGAHRSRTDHPQFRRAHCVLHLFSTTSSFELHHAKLLTAWIVPPLHGGSRWFKFRSLSKYNQQLESFSPAVWRLPPRRWRPWTEMEPERCACPAVLARNRRLLFSSLAVAVQFNWITVEQ